MKKKYIVVLAGSPRGGVKTWNSLLENVIDHLNADLAICTTDNYFDEDNILFQRAKHLWIMKNPKKFEDYYEKYFFNNWKKYLIKGKGLGLFESGKIHFALKDFVLRYYEEILKEYEYVIYSRFDQFYLSKHPDFNDDKIYIPEGEDYFGYCDRHVIFKSEHSKKILSIIDYIDSHEAINDLPKYLNCESVYKKHLLHIGLENKVSRYKRNSFTSALKGEPTNWRIPTYKIFLTKNLMIKYPDEFKLAVKNLFLTNFSIYSLRYSKILLYFCYLQIRNLIGKQIKSNKLICDVHGEMFTSQRYQYLNSCPECEEIN